MEERWSVKQAPSIPRTVLYTSVEKHPTCPESTGESFDGLIPFSRWCGGSEMTTWKLTASGNG